MSDSPPLPLALQAPRREAQGRSGRLSYYVDGQGPSLLLVHSINAAGSAYEMRPIFDALRSQRRVYAVDLPGFGFSDRSPRDYSVGLYVSAVHDMLDVIAADGGARPVDAIALSLGSEFLARAATQAPAAFRRLSFVTPTGFARGPSTADAPAGATRELPGLHRALRFPLWDEALFNLLVSRRSIRWFLGRTWGSKQIDEGLCDYSWLTSHQPGARHAPYAFVSGRLFSKDIERVYGSLRMPVWVPHGTRGDFKDMSKLGAMAQRGHWQVQAFDSGALPQFEKRDEFLAGLERFLGPAT